MQSSHLNERRIFMKNNKKMSLKILKQVIVFSLIFFALYSLNVYANISSTKVNTAEEIIDEYIRNMKNQDFDKVLSMVQKDIGYDAKVYNFDTQNKYVNEPDELNDFASKSKKDIILSQYEYIMNEFGDDSWDNVTYEIIKKDCPSKREEFINTENNKLISEKEALVISENYWKEFANNRGIEYNSFLNITEYSGELNEDEYMNILVAKELGFKPPICINYVDNYDFFIVELSFNSKNKTKDDVKKFRISIDNEKGSYKINYGLRWSVPITEENMSDI
jgi:hypothetical protein